MILLASDLHLTDKPEDSYRFDIFKAIYDWWKKHDFEAIVLLGDLTNEKDNHSSILTNSIVYEIEKLSQLCPVYILMGNHDYIDPRMPFFNFLNLIDNVEFIIDTTFTFVGGECVLLIPHSKEFKMPPVPVAYSDLDYIFIHQCVDGAIAETGKRLTGVDISPLIDLKPEGGIWAGDIHKPQRVGGAHYVGAPYNIRFGDNFEGRCILLEPTDDADENYSYKELKFDTPRKISLTIRDAEELEDLLNKKTEDGDFIKIKLQLSKEEVPDWPKQKEQIIKICKDFDMQLTGPTLEVMKSSKRRKIKSKEQASNEPRDVLKGFCKYEKIPSEIKKIGLEIIKES